MEDWRNISVTTLKDWLSRYESTRSPFPSGAVASGYEPSLMLGEAGMGLTLLLASGCDVWPVLLPLLSSPTCHGLVASGVDLLAREVNLHFPIARSTIDSTIGTDSVASAAKVGCRTAAHYWENVQTVARSLVSDARKVFQLTCADEMAKHELMKTDGMQIFLEELAYDVVDIDLLETADWRLSSKVRVYQKIAAHPEISDHCTYDAITWRLAVRVGEVIEYHDIGPFAGILLSKLQSWARLDQLVDLVALQVDGATSASQIREMVYVQLARAHEARFIQVKPGASLAFDRPTQHGEVNGPVDRSTST